jgi:hypothetical protein
MRVGILRLQRNRLLQGLSGAVILPVTEKSEGLLILPLRGIR